MILRIYIILMGLSSLVLMSQETLEKEFNNLLNDKDLENAHIGFSVVNTKTQKAIYEYQHKKWFSTASSLKLLTTAGALEYLGDKYRFKTILFTNSDISMGELKGDLVIRGTGDPTFASARYQKNIKDILAQIITRLKERQIKAITGNIVYDISSFEINPLSPKTYWLDLGNYYGGAVWPLNIDENIYRVTFSRTKQLGDSTNIIKIEPSLNLRLDNKVTIGGKTDEAYIYCAPYSNYGFIKGTLPPNTEPYTIKGAIPNPLEYFGTELMKALTENNITITGHVTYQSKPIMPKTVIWESQSPVLSEIVTQTNLFSINIYAEALIRAIALEKTGMALNERGTKILNRFVNSLKLDSSQLNICDGSGISPANMCSPNLMSMLLSNITQKAWFPLFYNSLSCSGVNGTLSNMGKGTRLEGNLRAKSGNMDGISSYAGYITTQNGTLMSFAIFINNFKADNAVIKKKIERLLLRISEL